MAHGRAGAPPDPSGRAPSAGELFVPFSILSSCGGASATSSLAIRIRSLEGHLGATPRLSVFFRFGPLVAGLRIDKTPNVSVKCQVDLVRQASGAWVPEGSNGGMVRVALPPMLTQSGHGIACRVKVSTPGFMTANVLAVSAPLQVPLEPQAVPMSTAKAGPSNAPPPSSSQAIATLTLSIGCIVPTEAQVSISRNLASQLPPLLMRPAGAEAPPRGGGTPTDRALAILDALRPSKGWLAAAGISQALSAPISEAQGKTPLRLAFDGCHLECARALIEAGCDPRLISEDLRSPLSAAQERGWHVEEFGSAARLTAEQSRASSSLSSLLAERRDGRSSGSLELHRRWDLLVRELAAAFGPQQHVNADGRPWPCDVYVLALEHCPTGKGRRELLNAEGACAALWRASLMQNFPDLARKLAVWIGLSVSNTLVDGPNCMKSRRQFLDVPLERDVPDGMLARVLQKAISDERWLRVARVMVQLGACVNAYMARGGSSLLLFALDQAEQGKAGFQDLMSALLEKLGSNVDHWDQPMVLMEENTADCPICFETLCTSTPTAFVSFASTQRGREGSPHVICAHFFCFDCASQQYMKQQSQQVDQYFCPLCRTPAREVMPLPDITVNPRLWFQFLDVESTNSIDRKTVVQALLAILPLYDEAEGLCDAMTDQYWADWDKTKSNHITESEFFAPGGLLEWVRSHQHELAAAKSRGPAPPLDQPEAWFKHWDRSRSGNLRRGDLLRALCEVAQASSLETKKVQFLKASIEKIWERHVMQRRGSRSVAAATSGDAAVLSLDRFLRQNVAEELKKIVAELAKGGGAGT